MLEVILEVLLIRHEFFKLSDAIRGWLFDKGLVLLLLLCVDRGQLFRSNSVEVVRR